MLAVKEMEARGADVEVSGKGRKRGVLVAGEGEWEGGEVVRVWAAAGWSNECKRIGEAIENLEGVRGDGGGDGGEGVKDAVARLRLLAHVVEGYFLSQGPWVLGGSEAGLGDLYRE